MRRATWKSRRKWVQLRRWRRAPLRMLMTNVAALFWFLMDWVTAQWIPALAAIILGILFWIAAMKLNQVTPRSEQPIWDELTETARPVQSGPGKAAPAKSDTRLAKQTVPAR